jgi:hypothetical protein
MIIGSFGTCRPFPPAAPYEIGEPVRHIEVIPFKHPVVAPDPKTPLPVRTPQKAPEREKEPV